METVGLERSGQILDLFWKHGRWDFYKPQGRAVGERYRTQDNLKFCFDLSTWKVVGPFSREEVGVGEEWGERGEFGRGRFEGLFTGSLLRTLSWVCRFLQASTAT